jgi:hypothetical protein
MAWLQSVHKGRKKNVLENYYIKFFQHNNMTINKQAQKEKKISELIYNLQLQHAYM